MRLALTQEIRRIEEETCRLNQKIDESSLMNQAGASMAQWIEGLLKKNKFQKICICVGPGNNGGDAMVVAEHLFRNGKNVRIVYFEKSKKSELWQEKFSDVYLLGLPIQFIDDLSDLDFSGDEIIIDGLFGIGLNKNLSDFWQQIIEKMNQSKKLIVSLDVPSGLDANLGWPCPVAVLADYTLSCEVLKVGFFLNRGSEFVGRLRVMPVGFDSDTLKKRANSIALVTPQIIPSFFPKRSAITHKARQGHLLIIAGSEGMSGALTMCAEAASRLGVGYVSVLGSPQLGSSLSPDFLSLSLKDFFKSDLQKYSSVVVGPGLGSSGKNIKILEHLRAYHQKVLVDADGLNSLAQSHLQNLPGNWLLTPHAGEMSRLIRISAKDIEHDRIKSVDETVVSYGCHVLLKGFRTVVSNTQKKFVIGAGNSALAKAGSGDVLSGFIGSLMAQGLTTDEAAVVGALIHGALADRWVSEGRGSFSLKASDLYRLTDWIADLVMAEVFP